MFFQAYFLFIHIDFSCYMIGPRFFSSEGYLVKSGASLKTLRIHVAYNSSFEIRQFRQFVILLLVNW